MPASSVPCRRSIILLSFLALVAFTGMLSARGATSSSSTIDFESYAPGDIDGVSGWKAEFGLAEVTSMRAHSGVQSLVLLPGPFEAEVVAPGSLDGAAGASVILSISGVPAVARPDSQEFMNLAGALVAVVAEDSAHGRIWVLDATPAGGAPLWRSTDALVPLDDSGTVAGWVTLRVDLDFQKNLWSLGIGDGAPVESGIGLATDPSLGRTCRFYGYANKPWWLDDLTVDAVLEPAEASSLSQGTSGGGERTVAPAFVACVAPPPPPSPSAKPGLPSGTLAPKAPASTQAPVALSKVVHVDGAKGDDANDGSQEHPKATLRAAFATLDPSGAEVHVAAGTYRLETKVFPAVRFIAEGRVVIQ